MVCTVLHTRECAHYPAHLTACKIALVDGALTVRPGRLVPVANACICHTPSITGTTVSASPYHTYITMSAYGWCCYADVIRLTAQIMTDLFFYLERSVYQSIKQLPTILSITVFIISHSFYYQRMRHDTEQNAYRTELQSNKWGLDPVYIIY